MSDNILDKEQLKKEILEEIRREEKLALEKEYNKRLEEHKKQQELELQKQKEKTAQQKLEEEQDIQIKEQTKKEFEEFVVKYKQAQEPFLKKYVDKEEALKFWYVLSEKFVLTPEVDVEYNIPESTITRDCFWCHLAYPKDIDQVVDVLIQNEFLCKSNKQIVLDFFKGLDKEPYYEIAVGIDYDTEKRIRFSKMIATKFVYKTLIFKDNKVEKEVEFTQELDTYKAYQSQEKILTKHKLDLHLAPNVLAVKNGETLTKIKFLLCGDPINCPGSEHKAHSIEIENDKMTFFVINPDSPTFSPTHNVQIPR